MKIAHKLTVVALLWLIFVNPGCITSFDTIYRLHMSHAWWTKTEESFSDAKLVVNIKGTKYIPYDLGQSMLMLPGDWLGGQLGKKLKNPLKRQFLREAVVSFFIFIPLNLLVVLSCWRFLRLLNYSEKVAALSTLVLLIGTSVLFYSSYHQQNNQILLFVLVGYQMALAYSLKGKKRLAIFSGMSSGIAFIIRITTVLHGVGVLIFLIGCAISQARTQKLSNVTQSVLLWMSGFIPFILLERILTYVRYDSWTATTASLHFRAISNAKNALDPNTVVQEVDKGFSFLSLLTKAKPGMVLAPFLSPEKSVFLYDPILIPCLILLFVCWRLMSRYHKWYVIATTVSFFLHVYIYSWSSGWLKLQTWGARYHLTPLHLLLIPLIPLLVRGAIKQIGKSKDILSKILILSARVAIVLAICIQLSSVVIDSSVEANQQRAGFGSRWRLIQRWQNIAALSSGSIEYEVKPTRFKNPRSSLDLQRKIEAKNQWDLLPFIYKSRLDAVSTPDNWLPFLSAIWIVILFVAVASTVWLFMMG